MFRSIAAYRHKKQPVTRPAVGHRPPRLTALTTESVAGEPLPCIPIVAGMQSQAQTAQIRIY